MRRQTQLTRLRGEAASSLILPLVTDQPATLPIVELATPPINSRRSSTHYWVLFVQRKYAAAVKPRLVLDTNVWLDWLVFEDPGIVPIRNAAGTGRVEIYIDAVCEE